MSKPIHRHAEGAGEEGEIVDRAQLWVKQTAGIDHRRHLSGRQYASLIRELVARQHLQQDRLTLSRGGLERRPLPLAGMFTDVEPNTTFGSCRPSVKIFETSMSWIKRTPHVLWP